jgi:hypothetical protein
MTIEQMFLMQA